ncbi:MAG: hypothetical protein ACFFC7_13205 [Candidatus Hermodarchaeota archaeon]
MFQSSEIIMTALLNFILFITTSVVHLAFAIIVIFLYIRTNHKGFIAIIIGAVLKIAYLLFYLYANFILLLQAPDPLAILRLLSLISTVVDIITIILFIIGLVLLANDLRTPEYT